MFIYIRCQQLDSNSKESGPKGPGFEPTPERASRVFPWWEVCWSNGALQNIKFQAPNYKQIPNSNTQWPKQVLNFGHCYLFDIWYLIFDICDLEFLVTLSDFPSRKDPWSPLWGWLKAGSSGSGFFTKKAHKLWEKSRSDANNMLERYNLSRGNGQVHTLMRGSGQ